MLSIKSHRRVPRLETDAFLIVCTEVGYYSAHEVYQNSRRASSVDGNDLWRNRARLQIEMCTFGVPYLKSVREAMVDRTPCFHVNNKH